MVEAERSLAVFIDFDNLALGFDGRGDRRFDIIRVLERLPGGWGIMADDVMAGVYGWVTLRLVMFWYPGLF